jgi:hypothetical protein
MDGDTRPFFWPDVPQNMNFAPAVASSDGPEARKSCRGRPFST